MSFSKEMAFPEALIATTATLEGTADSVWQQYFQVSLLSGVTGQISLDQLTWKVVSASTTKINLSLTYAGALTVSQGEVPDELVVLFKKGKFVDTDGLSLPPNLTKIANVPS